MPLRLVTGPANAAKAGEVLGGLRARLDEDPILLVPSFQDVEHAQRELAERGAVFGARVLRFDWLYRAIADRVGYRERVVSDVQRDLLLEASVERARLSVLAESAEGQGFIRAAARLVSELGAARVDPARFTQALRAWAGDGPRRAYADEVASVYAGYRRALDEAGLVDPELFAWRALDALRLEPARWDGAPVFVYGFDDFTVLELDALETLAVHCGAHVVVSLPFEPGREAFRATATVTARLSELAAERIELAAVDDHYDPASRTALHHVERSLFEADPGEPVDAGGAIAFHSAGGARSEVELAAARVLELLRGGTAPGDVAVVFRDPAAYSTLVEQVFGALRRALLARPLGAVRPHRARPRRARADSLRRRLGRRRRPARLPANARPREAAGAHRPARGRAAPGGSHGRRARPRDLGGRALAAHGRGPAPRRERRRGLPRRAPGDPGAPVRRPLQAPGGGADRAGARRPACVRGRPRRAHGAGGARRRGSRRGPQARGARARRARGPRGRQPAARPRARGASRGDPRPPLRGGARARAPGGRVPRRRPARALPARRRPPRGGDGEWPGAPAPGGPDRPRALPLLRVRVARRAPAGAQLALERRGGHARGALVLPRGRARAPLRGARAA